jgi:hypothetical protein
MAGLRLAIRPRDHRNSAGAVQPADWGRFGAFFLTVLGGTHGDHSDWEDIGAWADRIAQSVHAAKLTRDLPRAHGQLHS